MVAVNRWQVCVLAGGRFDCGAGLLQCRALVEHRSESLREASCLVRYSTPSWMWWPQCAVLPMRKPACCCLLLLHHAYPWRRWLAVLHAPVLCCHTRVPPLCVLAAGWLWYAACVCMVADRSLSRLWKHTGLLACRAKMMRRAVNAFAAAAAPSSRTCKNAAWPVRRDAQPHA